MKLPINILWLAALAGLVWMVRDMRLISTVRGIRNNNPGNIRWDGVTQWEGMTGSDDKGFIIFESVEYGIRAMARVLASYGGRGVDTVAGIVSTWAPSVENDTASYIASVELQTGLMANSKVGAGDYPLLIAAIIKHENGINPYSDALIGRGVSMA